MLLVPLPAFFFSYCTFTVLSCVLSFPKGVCHIVLSLAFNERALSENLAMILDTKFRKSYRVIIWY